MKYIRVIFEKVRKFLHHSFYRFWAIRYKAESRDEISRHYITVHNFWWRVLMYKMSTASRIIIGTMQIKWKVNCECLHRCCKLISLLSFSGLKTANFRWKLLCISIAADNIELLNHTRYDTDQFSNQADQFSNLHIGRIQAHSQHSDNHPTQWTGTGEHTPLRLTST